MKTHVMQRFGSSLTVGLSVGACLLVVEACAEDPSFTTEQVALPPGAEADAQGGAANGSAAGSGGSGSGDATAEDGNFGTEVISDEELARLGIDPEAARAAAEAAVAAAAADAAANGGSGDGTGAGSGTGANVLPPGSEGTVVFEQAELSLTQGAPKPVDILWVVDSSGSMAEEQAYLAANFQRMIASLIAGGMNFQTAVTSTDICDEVVPADPALRVCPVYYGGNSATHLRGSFVGPAGKRVLHKGQEGIMQSFGQYAVVGTNGSSFEHGMRAAHLAVQKSLNGSNEALIRPDAHLAVIVVSDEEDDGIGMWKMDDYAGYNFAALGLTTHRYTEDDFITYMRTVKGAGNFSVSAITGRKNPDGSMCTSPHSSPKEEGSQYLKAAAKTGGLARSICELDWGNMMHDLGLDIASQSSAIRLSPGTDPTRIKVRVNGEAFPYWTYLPESYTLKFAPDHIPPPGAFIFVSYYRPVLTQ